MLYNMRFLDHHLFVLSLLDTSPTAGGSHLTFLGLMQGFVHHKAQPLVYIHLDPGNKSRKKLESLGCKVLNFEKAFEFCQDPKNTAFFYSWGILSVDPWKELKPKSYIVRPSSVAIPFCSNVLKQESGCWNTCNEFKYAVHAPKRLATFKNFFPGYELRRIQKNASEILFPSIGMANLYRQRFSELREADSPKLKRIRECIELMPEVRGSFGWEKMQGEKPAVLLVSKWEPHKGLLDVLDCVSAKYETVVVGDGSDVARAKKLLTNRNIIWLGYINQLEIFQRIPRRRYVYIHAAKWYECLGKTNMEAMYAGIPLVICKDSGTDAEFPSSPYILRYDREKPGELTQYLNQLFLGPPERSKGDYDLQTQFLTQEAEKYHAHNVALEWARHLSESAEKVHLQ